MKKLLCSLTVITFALAMQAGESKPSATATGKNEKTASCTQKTSLQAKAVADSKSSCCSGGSCKDAPSRQALLSPKASGEFAKRM